MAGEQAPPYDIFATRFRRNANSLAARYGAPVLLVGGALIDEEPRDYDVRIVLSNSTFRRFYGGTSIDERPETAAFDYEPWEWRRAYDCLKQSRILMGRMMVSIDLQIQSVDEAKRYEGQRSIRLDTAPAYVLEAGRKRPS